jgi:hypothetical protein
MKIISNDRLINRNVQITKFATAGSLIILAVGIYFSLTQADKSSTVYITFAALVLGFITSQVSVYMQLRWGRSPRPDEIIIAELKGLDDRHTLFVYRSVVPYLLVSPTGLWGLIPYHHEGTISYSKDRFHQKGGNTLRKLFGGDGLGRPDLDAKSNAEAFRKELSKRIPELASLNYQPVLVFTNPKTQLACEDSPYPVIPTKKLKDFIRKKPGREALSPETLTLVAGKIQK